MTRWPARLAWRDFRAHPSRLVATLLAVVISVGFLAATQASSATETHAVQAREALYASQADVVVQTHLWHANNARVNRDLALRTAHEVLRADPDVVAIDALARLHTELIAGERMSGTMLTSVPDSPQLQWFTLLRGRLPTSTREVVLTTQTAHTLAVDVGSVVTLNWPNIGKVTVVGITADDGYADPPTYVAHEMLLEADQGFPTPAYGVVIDPNDTAAETPGSSGDGVGIYLLAKTRPGAGPSVATRTQRALSTAGMLRIYVRALSASEVRAQVAAEVGARPDVLSALVTGSAVVAVGVGALIISTTFSILVTQRRREVGALRALGASRRQVRGRFLTESLALAIVGSTLGVGLGIAAAALIAAVWTHSLTFGLVLPPLGLVAVGLAGVVTTMSAVLVPIHAACQIQPVDAMRPDLPCAQRRRTPILAALFAAGLAASAIWTGLIQHRALWVGIGVSVVILDLMVAAVWWVPALMRALAVAWPRRCPIPRVAFHNAARSPSRVATTSAALILSVMLISMVQTATLTVRTSAFAALDRRFPVDVAVQSADSSLESGHETQAAEMAKRYDAQGHLRGFPTGSLDAVRATAGVTAADSFETSDPVIIQNSMLANRWLPLVGLSERAAALTHAPVRLAPGQIGLPGLIMKKLDLHVGSQVHVSTTRALALDLTVVECNLASDLAVVEPGVLATLHLHTKPGLILARLSDPDRGQSAVGAIQAELAPASPGLKVSGATHEKQSVGALLDGLTAIVTGLLGIATVVALVGVANTLGLSALERSRENALLRALGLPRRGLWGLLFTEAIAITAVSIMVGVTIGVLGGYVIARAIALQFRMPGAAPRVGTPTLLAACLAVLTAGVVAAILPARSAAKVPPVAALADY